GPVRGGFRSTVRGLAEGVGAAACRDGVRRSRRVKVPGGELLKTDLVARVLRYPISATAAEKPLSHKGQESFPSWTSPVRPRSPALVRTSPSTQATRPRTSPRAPGGGPRRGRDRQALCGLRGSRFIAAVTWH